MKRHAMGLISAGEAWVPLPCEIAREARLTSSEFRIYIALASYYPRIFPSITKLMDDTGLARQTVVKSLRALRDLNVIRWTVEKRRRIYTLIDHSTWNLTARNETMSKRMQYTKALRERDIARRAEHEARMAEHIAAMKEEQLREDDR